jgi:nitroimidazol reductase NimA-like FMN-containing flavoprotein (pyridoxamine 5'-phosphate oxidase superfamily)
MRLVDPTTGIEVLPEDECLRRLGEHQVGRLVLIGGGDADIFPVNYVLVGRTIVFRTAAGTKWRDGPRGRAAFEVDELDPTTRSGWSVVVHGRLEDADERHPDTEALGLDPWSAHDKPHVMRLVGETFSGRRLPG